MRHRALGWMTLAGGLLVLLFWVAYWARAIEPEQTIARAYESAFPLADGLFAAALFAASRALFTGKRRGAFWLVVAAAICVYLGLLDATFFAQHGVLWPPSASGVVQLLSSAITIGGGAVGLGAGWRLWSEA